MPWNGPRSRAGLQFRVGAAGVGQRALLGHQDEGVQRGVACGDAGQCVAGQRFGGDGAGAQQAAHLGDGKILRVHHLSPRGGRRNTLDGSAVWP